MRKIRWGVLGAAKIARTKVIPAMQRAQEGEVTALASRSLETARAAAAALGIPKAYGSYEELLADPRRRRRLQSAAEPPARAVVDQGRGGGQTRPLREADRADAAEARALLAVRDRTRRAHRGSVHGAHPSAVAGRARDVRGGRIGELRAIQMAFSLLQPRPAERPQPGRHRRRRPDGHRLLSDRALALPVRARSRARVIGQHRPRPGLRHGPSDLGAARVPRAGSASSPAARSSCPTSARRSWARGAASRSRSRSTRRPTGRAGSSSTTDATPIGTGVETRTFDGLRPVHAPGGRVFARDPRRDGRPRCLWRTPSPTCGSLMRWRGRRIRERGKGRRGASAQEYLLTSRVSDPHFRARSAFSCSLAYRASAERPLPVAMLLSHLPRHVRATSRERRSSGTPEPFRKRANHRDTHCV